MKMYLVKSGQFKKQKVIIVKHKGEEFKLCISTDLALNIGILKLNPNILIIPDNFQIESLAQLLSFIDGDDININLNHLELADYLILSKDSTVKVLKFLFKHYDILSDDRFSHYQMLAKKYIKPIIYDYNESKNLRLGLYGNVYHIKKSVPLILKDDQYEPIYDLNEFGGKVHIFNEEGMLKLSMRLDHDCLDKEINDDVKSKLYVVTDDLKVTKILPDHRDVDIYVTESYKLKDHYYGLVLRISHIINVIDYW